MSADFPTSSPEWVVQEAFRAFGERDGRRLARVASAPSLEHYREKELERCSLPRYSLTAEDLQRYDPEMPSAVAEWQAARLQRERKDRDAEVPRRFAGVPSVAELSGMEAADMLHAAVLAAPEGALAIGCDVIGHVLESPTRAYVVFHLCAEEVNRFGEPCIATVERSGTEWRLQLDPFGQWGMPGIRNMVIMEETVVDDDDEGSVAG